MKHIHIIFIFCLFLLGCTNNKVSITENTTDENRYIEELNKFPPYLVDFFPKNIGDIYMFSQVTDTTNQCISFMNFDFTLKENKEISLHNLVNKEIASYNSSDSNLIIIKRKEILDKNSLNYKKYESISHNDIKYYPIPFFENISLSHIDIKEEDIYSNNTKSGLSEDFNIYILESRSGNYWEGLEPLSYMPEGWKNGYSKGISINKKKGIVIYWFIIW